MSESKFSQARDKYSEGISSLSDPQNEEDNQALAVLLHLNRSEANIKLQDWSSAVDDSSVAINVAKYLNEKQFAKAYYRGAHTAHRSVCSRSKACEFARTCSQMITFHMSDTTNGKARREVTGCIGRCDDVMM
jgi:hypothetical protein